MAEVTSELETRLARAASAASPDGLAAAEQLADLLLARERTDEAIVWLEEIARARPTPASLRRLGGALMRSVTRADEAEACLERAMAAGDDGWDVRYELGVFLLKRRELDRAVRWLQEAATCAPPAAAAGCQFELGNALRTLGRGAEARAAYNEAATFFLQEHERHPASLEVTVWLVRILFAIGQEAQAIELYRSALDGRRPETFPYGDGYLPDTPARLDRLRALVQGRDVAVLLHGPSIKELHLRAPEFAGFDLVFAGLSRFSPLETEILHPIGRSFSVVAGTNSIVLAQCGAQYLEFVRRPAPNLLVTFGPAVDALGPGAAAFHAADDRLLYFRSSNRVPPTPDDPLHFMPGNSLSVLLPLLLLAQPKRVFLFGADGGAPEPHKESHYLSHLPGFGTRMTPQERIGGARNVYWDALEFDELFPVQAGCLLALFGVEAAPVFNCSPHSHYESFPKISYDQCLGMLQGHQP